MKIKDRPEYHCKPQPCCMKEGDSAREAINMMTEKNFGSVIITNDDQTIASIVTERDLMTRLLYNKMNPDKTKLSEIMTREVRVAKEDDNLLDWLRIMSNERFRHLPVVDEDNKVVSMMSQGDFVSYTWPELLDRLKENVKASLGAGYQIFLIVSALLVYALIVAIFL